MAKRLNQHLALESQIKSETDVGTTAIHRLTQKPELFSGMEKSFEPLEEGATTYPPESKKVQHVAEQVTRLASDLWVKLFDFTATKDTANSLAKADVEVGETVLLKDVPVTTLLFLEKQLDYVRKFVETLPALDTADDWKYDEASGLHKTGVIKTHRTKKIQKPLVLYPATDKHPAQTQMIVEDVLEGHWSQTKFSGAIPVPRKQKILERIGLLAKAVKTAREGANAATQAERVAIGEAIFEFLLRD